MIILDSHLFLSFSLAQLITISASILQGSATEPASYVIVGSDLGLLYPAKSVVYFALATYLVVRASICGSRAEEIKHKPA